ncbi:M20/M25/M40 family metallo-hydrolase [Stappia sp. GBMRC 2046]|uniref:M20/M25/M40 family metallo-hydrolase n=1 Tax=Stappia sediminis TaxID=2692190 RepID=A0A7X3S762_9HYPH|nr:M20 family metallopeptidase [Stappia sediminis]MXN64483.1 M20/M25/M40 family metallo-hydrolase [Stappia sediminis]
MAEPDVEALVEGINRWVEVETNTPDAADLDRLMGIVAGEASGFGAGIKRFPGRSGRGGHLLVRSPWGGLDEPYILTLSHLDTVHPKGTLSTTLPIRRDGDKLYGPGVCDMKAGAYIALDAMRRIAEGRKSAPLPVWHLFTSDEEIGSPTSQALIEELGERAKYCIVTEPARNGGHIVTARKGVARFELIVEGRPSHAGARHHDGRSAIKELAHQILTLEAMTDYERGITVNVGVIQGGTGSNVIAQHARADIDLRVPTAQAGEEMVAKITGLKPQTDGCTVTVTGGMNRPPFEQSEASRRLFAHAAGLAEEIGFELIGEHTGGGSDGNFIADKVATIDGMGADGDGVHTLNEHIFVSSLVPRMTLIKRLYETLE